MAALRSVAGGRALLFERLVDWNPEEREAKPFILHDREHLKASVRIELERLLSTRRSRTDCRIETKPCTVLDYGIPDNANICPADPDERQRLADQIAIAIAAFEPRLKAASVKLLQASERGNRLIAEVVATLTVDALQEPLSFSIPVGDRHER